uniref:Mitogen-activated protein kinase kinase kinase kinase n=1 Tax=Geotrypetes seraphini TaxID=260995 RepID=A0A6P8S3H7_GEOSA|nr:mitogen-activated protein kinase kinase kinase kinase 1 isoform X2 [Geotrypetes seraphini]
MQWLSRTLLQSTHPHMYTQAHRQPAGKLGLSRNMGTQDRPDLDISSRNPQEDFELLQKVGGGTYGDVYKARNKVTGELAAIKIVKMEADDDFSAIEQEIQIVKSCTHHNIVAYYGSYIRFNKLWICMEFCGGGSLQDIYHVTGHLSEQQIAYVCRETLQGLAYLHNQGKIHRDIKGANILINELGDLKLADFGISAQITATISRRMSFIGTPYWMAPEVAAVELKGGYNELCDIWSLGITAIEVAELQPPMFDLHPLRVLFLMSKSGYQPPRLKDKCKWSAAFHNFLKVTLMKNPKKRPSASKMLSHQFVMQHGLSRTLANELLEKLQNPEKHSSYTEVEEEDMELPPAIPRRIQSTARHIKVERTCSDIKLHQIQFEQLLKKETEPTSTAEQFLTVDYGSPKRVSNYLCSSRGIKNSDSEDDYDDVDIPNNCDLNSNTLTAADVPPPLPPKPKFHYSSGENGTDEDPLRATSPLDQPPTASISLVRCASGPTTGRPPLRPIARRQQLSASSDPMLWSSDTGKEQPPTLPPKLEKKHKWAPADCKKPAPLRKQVGSLFKKVFNGCPLKITSTTSWTHPSTKDPHLILGAEEGIFILNCNEQEAILELLFPGRTTWVYSISNILMSISGKVSQLYSHSLMGLYEQAKKEHKSVIHISTHRLLPRKNAISTKVPDTKGCRLCCVAQNSQTGCQFLCGALEAGVILMQWYEPMQKFMLVKHFDYPLPNPLNVFEMLVAPKEEYPMVCIGVGKALSASSAVKFRIINLNSATSWFTDLHPGNSESSPVQVTQLESDLALVLLDNTLRIVDLHGALSKKTSVPEIIFNVSVESIAYRQNSIQVFWRHGVQVRQLCSAEVLEDFQDQSRTFRLVGSNSMTVVETRPVDEPGAASNLYIQE